MFSVPPVTSKFDSRLAAKFFELPAPEMVGAPKSILFNIGKIRTEIVSFLFLRIIQGLVTNPHVQMHLVDYLLNLYSPVLNFGAPRELNILTEETRLILEGIQDGLLLTIKNQLTLEMVLYYILEKKISYHHRTFQGDKRILAQYFTRVHASLYSYGPDPYFESAVDINNSSVAEINARGHEIYSHLMISLMTRLSTIGIFMAEYRHEQLTETAWAFILLHCKTVTLMYVIEKDKRKPLITYLQQPGKKNCDKVIYNSDLLSELILTIPPKNRLAVWQNSFTNGHLAKIIKSPVVFESLVAMFSKEEQVIVRAQFPSGKFLSLDPVLTAQFFTAVTPSSSGATSAELLMQARRGILAQALRDMYIDAKYQFVKHQLINAILNVFAIEVGINTVESTQQQALNDPSIQSLLLEFSKKIAGLLTLSNIIEFIYQTKLKVPIENLLIQADQPDQELINRRLDAYGEDAAFSQSILFEEYVNGNEVIFKAVDDDEIEWKVSISLVHRLANLGFVDLNKAEKLTYEQDAIHYFQDSNFKIAFVNVNERIPLIKFLFNRSDDRLARFFRHYPAFSAVVDYFPLERKKSFFQRNCTLAPLFINNFTQFHAVLKDLLPEHHVIIFKNITRMFLEKVLTRAEHYAILLEYIPITLMKFFVKIIPISQFEEFHDSQAKFSNFMSKLFWEVHEKFLSRLSDEYLQNIHPSVPAIIDSVQRLSLPAVKSLFKKLGSNYLQCVFSNSNKLFMLGAAVEEQKYEIACNSFDAKHLREIFNNQMSLTNLSFIKTNKLSFMVKLINAGCGCYESLFTELTFLSNALKLIPGQELNFTKIIKIDFNTVVQTYAHLLGILKTFNHSLARVTFCLRLGANLRRFVTNVEEFTQVYNLFNEMDKLFFQNKTTDFNDYLEDLEKAQRQKIEDLTGSLDAILTEFNNAQAYVTFPPCPINDLLTTSLTLSSRISKLKNYVDSPPAEQLLQTKLIFLEVVNCLEQAFNGQIWKKSGDQRFFGRPRLDLIKQLNSEFRGFHYTRFLGVLLHKIFTTHEAELITTSNPLHKQIYALLKDIKIPPAHDKLLFLIPDEKADPSPARTSLKM